MTKKRKLNPKKTKHSKSKVKDVLRGKKINTAVETKKNLSKLKTQLQPKTQAITVIFDKLSKYLVQGLIVVGKVPQKVFKSKSKQWQKLIQQKKKKTQPQKTKKKSTKSTKSQGEGGELRSKGEYSGVKKGKKYPAPGSFHAKHPKLILFFKIIFFPIINPFARYLLLLILLSGIAGIFYILKDLPSPRRLTSKENYAVSTQIFDRNGSLLYEIYGEENRIPIKLETLPPHVYQASIAIEDKNFLKHHGFDIEGIARAIKANIEGDRLEGGSTITQQLVKNALLTPERSMKRKVKEGILSIFTELLYTKEEIIEMYLNYISYGGTSLGIQAASKSYFDKNASELTLAEATLLAGLPQAPSRYSPFGSNPKQAKDRQAEVLRRMAEDGYITQLQAEEAKAEVLNYALSQTEIKAPHFVFYVRDLLYEKYGEEAVEQGGLRVTTTLDLKIQNTAQASLSAEVDRIEKRYRVSNGAALVVKPNTGEILAMIGSRDYFNATVEGEVNVTIAERQPGSSIKPIMYSTAFQNKTLNPGSVLLDIPTCFNVPGQKPYCPKNYDGTFKGPVTIRNSIGNSLNIPAVKSLNTIGVENFMDQATKMGITTWKDPVNYGLSLTLGGGEVKMIDMVQAFGVLANQGVKVPLTPFLEIKNYKGKTLEKIDTEKRIKDLDYLTNYDGTNSKGDLTRVMDRAPAYLTSHIMQDNNARKMAFGPSSDLVIPDQIVSAKTGTTNLMKDNWTVGFTPEYLVMTWVGNNDGTPMSGVASGITGASPIWNDIMSYMLQGRESIWQEKPADVLSGGVCATGLPPEMSGKRCSIRYTEFYWEEGKPSRSTMFKQQIWVRPETGLPPKEGEPTDGLVLEEHVIYQDPLTDYYCSDCTRPMNEQGKTIYERQQVQGVMTTEILELKIQEMLKKTD